jgi:excinuclease ABC subunit C
MNIETLKKKNLPDAPGVYFFYGPDGEILYIGKATSLKDRVRSYFASDIFETRGPLIQKMVSEATDIGFQQADSVLEALILETNLIKKHKPPYNTMEKDDKSFNYVVITDEDFPQVMLMRGRNLLKSKDTGALMGIPMRKKMPIKLQAVYGPFPEGLILKEALRIIRKIFPFRDNKCTPFPYQKAPAKPCFSRQIGLCPGVCTGEISQKDYAKIIRNIRLFFEGKKKTLLKTLEQEMKAYSKKQEFEQANKIKQTIFRLTHIQDVSLIKEELKVFSGESKFRIEAYDVAHTSGESVVGVMTVIENGQIEKSEYRKFKLRNPSGNDIASLKEILKRRLNHPEWRLPNIIAVDGGKAQKNAAEDILHENNLKIIVVGVTKDQFHRPIKIIVDQKIIGSMKDDILIANSEAHRFAIKFHRKLRDSF